jgi:transposase
MKKNEKRKERRKEKGMKRRKNITVIAGLTRNPLSSVIYSFCKFLINSD